MRKEKAMIPLFVPRFEKNISERLRAYGSVSLAYILMCFTFTALQNRAEAQTHQEYIIWSAALWPGNYWPEWASSPALAQDGTIYISAQAQDSTFQQVQAVIAFQPAPPAGGSVFSAFIAPGTLGSQNGLVSSPMLADDGSVYVGNNDLMLYAFLPAFTYPPLQPKWTQTSPNINAHVFATPALKSGVLYIGEDDCEICQAFVRAFDLNGNPKWQYYLGGEFGNGDFDSSLSISAAGKVIGLGEHNGLLTALTPGSTSATKYWDAAVPSQVAGASQTHFNASPAMDGDGTTYIGGEIGVTAVCQNGETLWTFVPRPANPMYRCFQSSPVIGTNHSLYIGGEDGLLYALNTTNNICGGKRLKWTFFPQDWLGLNLQPITSTPATASQGIIYVTMMNPNDNTSVLFAVRDLGTSAQELWRVQLTGLYTTCSPNIGLDGTVYIADDRNLYAIQSPTHLYNGPANTPWPMYQHDQRHTGFVGTQISACSPDFAGFPYIAEAWYRFSENAFNQSGPDHSGTMTGSYSWITRDPWGSSALVALNLSANLSGMTVPDSLNLNFTAGQNITIEGWIMPQNFNTPSGVMDIVDKRIVSGGNAKGYALYLLNGKLMFQMGLSTGNPPTIYGPFGSDLRNGVWHYVAISVNRASSSGGLAFIDGVAYTFNPVALNGDLTTTASVLVGLTADSSVDANFRGGLDEISIWRRALNPSELYSIFHAGYIGKCNY